MKKIKKPLVASRYPLTANSGFSLIELMVAMMVIVVLLSLTLTSYQGSRKTVRDSQRKAGLEQIRSALEMYRADNGEYPGETGCDSSRGSCGTCPCPDDDWASGSGIATALEPDYINNLPLDPINNDSYFYDYEPVCSESDTICGSSKDCTVSANCCAYRLRARLEATGLDYDVCNP